MFFHHHIFFFPFFPGVFGWIVMALLLVPYFLPTIIAIMRGKNNVVGVFALNFFLGWTLIGWVASLLWALSSDGRPTVIVNNPPPVYNQTYTPGYSGQQTNPTLRPNGGSPAASPDKYDQLRRLKQLHDEGILTDEEFNKQKAAILG